LYILYAVCVQKPDAAPNMDMDPSVYLGISWEIWNYLDNTKI